MTRRGTPAGVMLIALCVLATLAAARWTRGDRDWSFFAVVGAPVAERENAPLPPALADLQDGDHYDGLFYLRLAIAPLSNAPTVHGLPLDDPRYRHQRILYPALAWALSLGRAEWAPFALVLVNLLALTATAGVWALLARELALPAGTGLLVLGIPGLLLAFGRDTAEPVSALFLSLSFLLLLRGRYRAVGLALSLAVLAREDSMVLVAALAVALAWRWRETGGGVADRTTSAGYETGSPGELRRGARAVAVALPVMAFIAWQAVLRMMWGAPAATRGLDRVGLPGVGIREGLAGLARQPAAESAVQLLYLGWYLLLWAEAGRMWKSSATPSPEERADPAARRLLVRWAAAGLILWAGVGVILSASVWGDEWSFARVLVPAALCGLVLLFSHRRKPSGTLSVLTAIVVLASTARLMLRP